MPKQLSPGSTGFTVTIFKIFQMSKHLSAMPFRTHTTHQIVKRCQRSFRSRESHLTVVLADCKLQVKCCANVDNRLLKSCKVSLWLHKPLQHRKKHDSQHVTRRILCYWSRLSCVLKNVQNIFVNEMTSLIGLLVGFEYYMSARKTVNKWLYEEWKVCTHILQ